MPKFKITVVELTEPDERGYEKSKDVYEQIVENLDVTKVIAVVNGLTTKDRA